MTPWPAITRKLFLYCADYLNLSRITGVAGYVSSRALISQNSGSNPRYGEQSPVVSMRFSFQFQLKIKTSLTMRWDVDTDPLMVLHAKPLLVKKPASDPAASPEQ